MIWLRNKVRFVNILVCSSIGYSVVLFCNGVSRVSVLMLLVSYIGR